MQKRHFLPALGMIAMLTLSSVTSVLAKPAYDDDQSTNIKRVLLISVDGLHAADLKRFEVEHPLSTLALLSNRGITYSKASAPRPTDSFPGLMALITGGTPKTTGVYYDDSYDRALLPPVASNAGDAPGTEVVYDETVDKNLNALDGGGGINPDALPRDPVTRKPVYPHSFLRVNTIFEVAKANGKRTAWSDKHLSYEIVNGPSGTGVDDLYTPEIAAGGTVSSLTATEAYDDLKVAAVLNEIDGKDHTSQTVVGMPSILGMNFQAVSVGQKLPGNGYVDANGSFSAGLTDALSHTDASLGKMVAELKRQNQYRSTMIIITAKHGQSPIDPTQLKFIAKGTLTAGAASNIAQLTADDIGLIWLKDQTQTNASLNALAANRQSAAIKDLYSFGTSSPKWLYDNPSQDSRTPDIVVQPELGVIYGKSGAKIAEHGGFLETDTNVALLISTAKSERKTVDEPVETKQVAPTILRVLGLEPRALQAVQAEGTKVLLGFRTKQDDRDDDHQGGGNGGNGIQKIKHVIVIYQENWSFDSYFGSFPGASGLANAGDTVKQVSKKGDLLTSLPQPINNSVSPAVPDSRIPANLPVAPYDLAKYVPPTQKTGDMVHRFYQEQYQIDGGKMDKFVAWSDNGGLVMSYYDASNAPLGKLAQTYTMADNFFHAAFGGSFLNHFWLVCACSPTWPNAPVGRVAKLDANGILVTDGSVTPDGYAVNTTQPLNQPHAASVTDTAQLLPLQTMPNIGDRLSDKQISWAWYSGGWNDAVAGHPDPLFQFHHQVFNYFANYSVGKPARSEHLKDVTDFQAAVANGTLPAVSFIKPLGPDNEHPGYADVVQGQQYIVGLINSVLNSPYGKDTAIIVTYDENGGRWDHVPPPVIDRWGPGTRVPAIIISAFAKRNFVDHTQYDTTSILKFIEKRWHLTPLGPRDASANDLTAAFDFEHKADH